jgi:predicted Zn-dependent protease with MMP-like domain
VQQVREAVIHELGHHFGLDDDEMNDLPASRRAHNQKWRAVP